MNEWILFFIIGNICSIAAFGLPLGVILHKRYSEKKEAESKKVQAFLQKEYETLEKRKAFESEKEDFWLTTEEEIAKRKSLMKKDTEQRVTALETMPQWSRTQVCGIYDVKGQNPLKPQEPYFGELQIKERDEVLLGTWKFPTRKIGASQPTDEGTGLLVGNMLAFNFKHTDPQDPYTGVVSYQIISDGVMRGLWTAFGRSNVGFEECQKKKPDE